MPGETMFIKIKNLCQKLQPQQQQQLQLSLQVRDDLATTIFGQGTGNYFVLSSHPPRTRHKIDVDDKVNYIYDLEYRDAHLPGFEKLGPNEKYVVHKIFHSSNPLVCIIGGIGVGKTSFSEYLSKNLIPKVFHEREKDNHHCPGVVYFDFNAYNNVTFPKSTEAIAERSFVRLLSTLINDRLIQGKFFSISEQVGEVWNEILRDSTYHRENNSAISILRGQLDENELDEKRYNEKPDEVIGHRKSIRTQLINSEFALDYFAALLNYVKLNHYKTSAPCLCLIIDNVDREVPEIQQVIERIVRSLAEQCDAKVIFNIRQTTYHQGSIDRLSKLVDKVAYCGPIPLEVVYSRIDNFVNKDSIYEKCLEKYKVEQIEIYREKLKYIKENFLKTDRFTNFFQSLCGQSVRKGLMIAQSLILNSVYNPMDIPTGKDRIHKSVEGKDLRMGDIIRALLVRTNETFDYRGAVENVFQTQKNQNTSHFIKLRILKAVRMAGEDGIIINRLVSALKEFKYSEELIIDSLDEMLTDLKRLIWTNTSSTEDGSSEYLIKHKPNARIFSSSIGEGYINFLYKHVDYIQEVMMDTSVESSYFRSGWNPRLIEDRLTLVLRFCEYLFKQEQSEVKEYFKKNNPDNYERIFGDRNLISLEIIEEVEIDVDGILDFAVKHWIGDFLEGIEVFKESQAGLYFLLIREAKIFQKHWFGN
jgi:hypothetical protein